MKLRADISHQSKDQHGEENISSHIKPTSTTTFIGPLRLSPLDARRWVDLRCKVDYHVEFLTLNNKNKQKARN